MSEAVGSTKKGKRRRRSSITWVGAAAAVGTLLSGAAAMITAANGIWHPPVPIPVIQARVTWIGPTPASVPSSAIANVPSAGPGVAASPTAAATTARTYRADWSNGIGSWLGGSQGSQWKVPYGTGYLEADGTDPSEPTEVITAPYQPETPNYAIEATITVLRPADPSGCYFGIVGRRGNAGFYLVGYQFGSMVVATGTSGGISAVSSTHGSPPPGDVTYRAEFAGDQITLKVNGQTVVQAQDARFTEAGQIGLIDWTCQIRVSTFIATAL